MSQAMERVSAARDMNRPTGSRYIAELIDSFFEMHGDRRYSDDRAIVGGVGFLKGIPVTVVALEKGSDTKGRISRNFGSAHPEGYRKALRLMKQAERFCRPVVCFVDTAGAFCGVGAEERGQGLAIAENLMEMMQLKVPIISVFTGEGGSGGALALAVGDEVWMLENAVYSVISPEGCASILWKDAGRAKEAAETLKLTAQDLLELQVVERVIPEDGFEALFLHLKEELFLRLTELMTMPEKTLQEERYQRFRKMGVDALSLPL